MTAKPTPKDITDKLSSLTGTTQAVSTPYKQPSRKNKAQLLTQHDPAVLRQLKMLAARLGTTQQKLVAEGLNMVFLKHGEHPIA